MERIDNFDKIPEIRSAQLSMQLNRNLSAYQALLRIDDSDLRGRIILDLGSGPKQLFAQEAGERIYRARVFSLDAFLDTQLETGRGVVGLFGVIPYLDCSFDMVVSVAAMPFYIHTPEQADSAFREAKRVLKIGGVGYFGPVTHTKIVSDNPSLGTMNTHKKYSGYESEKMLQGVLEKIPDIECEFISEIFDEYSSRHTPSVLKITRLRPPKSRAPRKNKSGLN